jgi:hypothetical protein
VSPDPIRVDPILDAAPGVEDRMEWFLASECTDCGTVALVVVPAWSLGDALCLPCIVQSEVAAEVDAALGYRLTGRCYAERSGRLRSARHRIKA